MALPTSVASLGADAQRQVREQLAAQMKATGKTDAPRPSKYGNVRTPYRSTQGFERTYDSKLEAGFAARLDQSIRAGAVLWWVPQARFPLPGGVVYVCDFLAAEATRIRVIDCKSVATVKLASYRIKKRLMKETYGIEIEEVTR